MRLIVADPLLKKTADLEAVALEQAIKYDQHENPIEWHRWTSILKERTDFKYDLMDAPTVDAVEIVRCKDCGHFHYDMPYVIQGVPVLGHEVCDFWGDGCKTSENGYCSFAERREDETN